MRTYKLNRFIGRRQMAQGATVQAGSLYEALEKAHLLFERTVVIGGSLPTTWEIENTHFLERM